MFVWTGLIGKSKSYENFHIGVFLPCENDLLVNEAITATLHPEKVTKLSDLSDLRA